MPHPLRRFRKEAGWRQEDLATQSGIDQGTISRLESGETKQPDTQTLRALARALNKRFRRLHHPAVRFDQLVPWRASRTLVPPPPTRSDGGQKERNHE